MIADFEERGMAELVESVAVREHVACRNEPFRSAMRSVHACPLIDGSLNCMTDVCAVMPRMIAHNFLRTRVS